MSVRQEPLLVGMPYAAVKETGEPRMRGTAKQAPGGPVSLSAGVACQGPRAPGRAGMRKPRAAEPKGTGARGAAWAPGARLGGGARPRPQAPAGRARPAQAPWRLPPAGAAGDPGSRHGKGSHRTSLPSARARSAGTRHAGPLPRHCDSLHCPMAAVRSQSRGPQAQFKDGRPSDKRRFERGQAPTASTSIVGRVY